MLKTGKGKKMFHKSSRISRVRIDNLYVGIVLIQALPALHVCWLSNSGKSLPAVTFEKNCTHTRTVLHCPSSAQRRAERLQNQNGRMAPSSSTKIIPARETPNSVCSVSHSVPKSSKNSRGVRHDCGTALNEATTIMGYRV